MPDRWMVRKLNRVYKIGEKKWSTTRKKLDRITIGLVEGSLIKIFDFNGRNIFKRRKKIVMKNRKLGRGEITSEFFRPGQAKRWLVDP